MSLPPPQIADDLPREPPRWAVFAVPLAFALGAYLLLGLGADLEIDSAKYTGIGVWSIHRLAAGDPHWWSPALGNIPYFNKPPLGLWWAGLFAWTCGHDPASVRLSQLVALGAMIVFTVASASRLMGRRAAMYAGVILACTADVATWLDSVILDYVMVALIMGAVWMAVRARDARTTARACGWFVGAGVPIGLAMLTKPLAPILALPMLVAWIAASSRPRRWTVALVGLFAIPVACAVAAPWHIAMWHLHGQAFIDEYIGHQSIERATGESFDAEPLWYYLVRIASTYWPWLAVLAACAWMSLRHKRRVFPARDIAVLCAIWVIAWLVLASSFADKRGRYIMQVYPMLAWICGAWLAFHAPKSCRNAIARRIGPVAVGAVAVVAVFRIAEFGIFGSTRTEWLQLAAYLSTHADAPVWTGQLIDNQRAKVYLSTGRWPETDPWIPGQAPPGANHPPDGALVIYAPRSKRGSIPDTVDLTRNPIVFWTNEPKDEGIVVVRWNTPDAGPF